ncbi:uncharacterized protein B0J16DRAFT_196817 [Fusarium flagelliforme]|uniref:DUF7514 domain-containing protein n=1 Tax=Fusarium flagelliforme TaxID=2675880 RepID=A0A395MXB7_9HYPO|nr:uncharacterized protein B0J16DRAFT_196817 [Fusarium flagelliforme]KAH7173767.1 hypothetical protein B0J16DRAFT_196817 [Fusarium flagelliforme]RFN52546.1 hypothetical protein FIE12Z_3129 [Fusarium flagelliforme]
MFAEPSPSPMGSLAMNGGAVGSRVHKAETKGIQISQSRTKDNDSVASGSTASTDSQMKKRMSADMSKEQVEDLVRKLTIDEMKTRWFDEIFEKVKSELVEEHSPADSTPSSSEPPSPKSNPVKPTPSQQSAPQQPVRDDIKKPEPTTTPVETKNKPNGPISSSRSSLGTTGSPSTSYVSDSTSSNQLPPRPKSAPKETSPPVAKARPSVRFSKAPIILNEDPEPPRHASPPRPASRAGPPTESLRHAEPPRPASRAGPPTESQRHAEPPRPASRAGPPTEPTKQGPMLSTVDLKWGRLFDDKGDPTARLGQVLRGIANYLVVEYSPRNSLVVTPEKLKAFYHEYKLDNETFPFQQIFDCRPHGALDSLETLYQHLRCENHLVQRRPGGMPHIPSLTPSGFERWMTCQIRAFPDQEAKRLNHIMADLPIIADGAFEDGKPERLPKQLSRHLIPVARHRETHDLVVDAITGWVKHTAENENDLRRNSSEEVYKSSSKDDKAGRYRPDDYRDRDAKYRRGPKDDYKPSPLPRSEPSSHRFIQRPKSENTMRPSRDSPIPSGSSHRARSPVSNRYRNSTPTVESSSGTPDNYDIPSPGHRNSYPSSSSRRNRDKDCRYSSGRDTKSPVEAVPRTLPRRDGDRRSSLIFEETGKDPNGMTYDEYLRLNPRPMRNAVVDDGGHYRNLPYSSGSDERAR